MTTPDEPSADGAKLAAIRQAVVGDFLGMYGNSSLPAFKVAIELAWDVRAILDGAGIPAPDPAAAGEVALLKSELDGALAEIRRLRATARVVQAAEDTAARLAAEVAAERDRAGEIRRLCEAAVRLRAFRHRGDARLAAQVLEIIGDRGQS